MEKDEKTGDIQETAVNTAEVPGAAKREINVADNFLPTEGTEVDAAPADLQDNTGMETPRVRNYADIIAGIRKRDEVSPAQEEKDRKRQRAMLVLGALSDGIAGMANIFAARKGALPVWHDPVTNELDARYRAILDERRRRSGYWNDAEARVRMADLNEKLRSGHCNSASAKIRETSNGEYADGIKRHGAVTGGKSANHEVSPDESTRKYADNTVNNKKQTGINW